MAAVAALEAVAGGEGAVAGGAGGAAVGAGVALGPGLLGHLFGGEHHQTLGHLERRLQRLRHPLFDPRLDLQPQPDGWRLFASHASFNLLFGFL